MVGNAIYCSGFFASLVFLLKRCGVLQKLAVVSSANTTWADRSCKPKLVRMFAG